MRTANITNKLNIFHHWCLRTIMGISWQHHITNDEVIRRVGVTLLSDMVANRSRRLAGHVTGWVPEGGRRKRGRPKIYI